MSGADSYSYIVISDHGIHEPTIECELAVLCLQYLTFECFETGDHLSEQKLRNLMLEGHFAFQDYAVAKWFHHVNAFVEKGQDFLDQAVAPAHLLRQLAMALDNFMALYSEEDWEKGLVQECRRTCEKFQQYSDLHDSLVLLTSHIYTFQQKGFEARHKISINSLALTLERNRKLLETPKSKLSQSEQAAYAKFYDSEKRYKCTKITCRYFSQGFREARAKKRHINIHDRPYQCEVADCLGGEGFAHERDFKNHKRSFHPEACDLSETFNSSTKKAKAIHACMYCSKTFTRNFHRNNHEKSHRGERPHECPECGKAFTRLNDCKRHQKLHERGK